MKNTKGSMAITSLILFSVVMVIILFVIEIPETQLTYNINSNEALQHKFILDSHFNYMVNDDIYYNKIFDNIRSTIQSGSAREWVFKIDEKVVDSKSSVVKMNYNREEDILSLSINNRYKGMEKHIDVISNMINPFYLSNHNGIIIYNSSPDDIKKEIDLLFNDIKQNGYVRNKCLRVVDGNYIVNNDTYFRGILIVVNGRIIVEEDSSLLVEGLVICESSPIGNLRIKKEKYDIGIKIGGINLTNFFKPKLINKKLFEGIR